MAIEIKIDTKEETQKPSNIVKVYLKAKKNLDGSIAIYDHDDIDIVLIPQKVKILTIPKGREGDLTYFSQNKFFDFLRKKGLIDYETVQGGNIYGSLEAKLSMPPDDENIDITGPILIAISEFIKLQKPFTTSKDYKKNIVQNLFTNDPKKTTELGEIPQGPKKGSMDQRMAQYGLQYKYLYQ